MLNNFIIFENCSIINSKFSKDGNDIQIHGVAKQKIQGIVIYTPIFALVNKKDLNSKLPKRKEIFTISGEFRSNPNKGVFLKYPSIVKSSSGNPELLSSGMCIIGNKSEQKFFFSDKPNSSGNSWGVFFCKENTVLNIANIGYSINAINIVKNSFNKNEENSQVQPTINNQAQVNQAQVVNNQKQAVANNTAQPVVEDDKFYSNTNSNTDKKFDTNNNNNVNDINSSLTNSNSLNEIILDKNTIEHLIGLI